MLLNDSDIEDIRKQIANEPEGSPARLLLGHIDGLTDLIREQAAEDAAREHERQKRKALLYFKERGHTEEEAERLFKSLDTGEPLRREMGRCNLCEGRGREMRRGCLGARFERCRSCKGAGELLRYVVPPV